MATIISRSPMTLHANARGLIQYLRMIRMSHRHNHQSLDGKPMRYVGPVDLLLKKGRFFRPVPLPESVRPGTPKHCFCNAFRLARTAGYTYVEGYAISMIPMAHAWCIDRQGHVIDNTWTGDLSGKVYFGLPFNLDYLCKVQLQTKTYGVLFNYGQDYPLCTGEDSLEEAVPKEWLRKF